MNVRDLIQLLEDYDEDTEVRIAEQPSWPFENDITDVVGISLDIDDMGNVIENEDDVEEGYVTRTTTEEVVYLVEGRQIGYLPQPVKEQLGW